LEDLPPPPPPCTLLGFSASLCCHVRPTLPFPRCQQGQRKTRGSPADPADVSHRRMGCGEAQGRGAWPRVAWLSPMRLPGECCSIVKQGFLSPENETHFFLC
jgi:hypothetical protein